MSFLSPWLLLLGVAAAVPLLLHLLRRRMGRQVEFPAVRYLARAEREHSRTLRLRNLLLMVLRVAAVCLIALAAARPVGRFLGRGHGPSALAVVLDNSLSTTVVEHGRPLNAHLEELAQRTFAAATPRDRLWLVTADGTVRQGTSAELLAALPRIAPLAGAGSPELAMQRAVAAVRASGLDAAQVVVLTDAQRTAWPAPPHANGIPILVWAPDELPPANRAVTAAEAQPHRWTPQGAVAAHVQARDSAVYRIALGPRSLARGTAAPGQDILVRAAPRERGWLAGDVELDPDELAGDNIRYFAVWVGTAPRVQAAAGAGTFVASAVAVLHDAGQVVSGAGVQIASADAVTALPALVIAPADPVRVGAANRALERLGVPWRFGAVHRDRVSITGVGLGPQQALLRFDLQHTTTGAAPSDTLARVGVQPWVVAGPRYVIVASPLDPAASTLPVSPQFIPWLADLLGDRLSGDPGRTLAATPAQRLPWPEWADSLQGVGTGGPASAAAAGNEFSSPANAGVYFFTRGGKRVGALVVNPEPDESALERWTPDAFARLLGPQARVVSSDAAFASHLFTGSGRSSLVGPILLLLLATLIAEGIATARAGALGARD